MQADLGLKINLVQSGLIDSVHNLFERRLEREGLVKPNPVGEGQAWPTTGTPISKDHCNELGSEGIELVIGLGVEEREELVEGWTLGPSCNQAQHYVDRERREHEVRVLAFG